VRDESGGGGRDDDRDESATASEAGAAFDVSLEVLALDVEGCAGLKGEEPTAAFAVMRDAAV
jgi:hypothetical protein